MIIRLLRKFLKFLGLLIASGTLVLLLSRLITSLYAYPRIYSVYDVPEASTAIVFGAGLQRDGTPTPVLRDRVATAAQLFSSGKVEKLLMSGDSRTAYYNEPAAMQKYAVSLGVPEYAIVLDLAGQRTYDTCYRAMNVFGVKNAILVTQQFHLPRALYTCRVLGLHAFGVNADRRNYRKSSLLIWNIRELLATITALWDVHIVPPNPTVGETEPIFPTQSQ